MKPQGSKRGIKGDGKGQIMTWSLREKYLPRLELQR